MASHDPQDRRRPRRQRPPRYSDDESDSTDDEYVRRPRGQRGPRTAAPGPGYPIEPPPNHVRPPSPTSMPTGPPPRRGPPILVEDPIPPSPPPGPAPRARSSVRIKTPSDASSDDGYRRERSRKPRPSRKDLERKNSTENIQFRERRDGYLSDEGEMLKKSRKPRPRRDDDDSDSKRSTGKSLKDKLSAALPIRSNPRAKSMEPPPPYGADPRGPPREDGRRPRRSDYDAEPDGRPQRSRSHREPGRRPYDDDYDDYDDRPRRRPEPRDDRRRSTGLYPPDPDRGYRSDHGARRRDDYRRDDYERDPYDKGRRSGGYRDYHSDRDDDRRRDTRRRDYGNDPRDRDRDYGRRDRDRDRYRSSRDYDDPRGGRSRGKSNAWQKDAGQLFLTYGLPYLKKEGPALVKQAQQYWAGRRG